MGDFIINFPYWAHQIFNQLDAQSLFECQKVNEAFRMFINSQIEAEKQRQIEAEKRQIEAEKLRQMEIEAEKQRQMEIEAEKQRQIEAEKQRQIEDKILESTKSKSPSSQIITDYLQCWQPEEKVENLLAQYFYLTTEYLKKVIQIV